MANPQKEDGYTPIANEIVEALCKINLSAYESRVLWYLFRKTYGWSKKTDRIALSQFSRDIGLDRRLVFRALRGLSSKKMIVIYKDDKGYVTYGFQKNYEKWVMSSKKMTVICRDDGVSSKEIHKLSSKEIPTKEIKETIQKKGRKTKVSSKLMTDEEWLEKIKSLYPTLDVPQEINNCKAHFLPEEPSRQRIRNWLKIAVERKRPFKGNMQGPQDDAYSHLEVIHHGKSD